jgi:hypothetical protein
MQGSTFTHIVAIDLGKFNSVICRFNPADATHCFQSIVTTPQAVHDPPGRSDSPA